MQVSDFPAKFKADFCRFRRISAVFRPISVVSAAGRYDPILAESARFDANRSRFGTNRAASARIEPSRRESEKKKKKKTQTWSEARATASNAASRVGRECGTSGAVSVLSSLSLTEMNHVCTPYFVRRNKDTLFFGRVYLKHTATT